MGYPEYKMTFVRCGGCDASFSDVTALEGHDCPGASTPHPTVGGDALIEVSITLNGYRHHAHVVVTAETLEERPFRLWHALYEAAGTALRAAHRIDPEVVEEAHRTLVREILRPGEEPKRA